MYFSALYSANRINLPTMPLDSMQLPDDETLDTLDKLLQGGTNSTSVPVQALTLQYLEALALDPDSVYRTFQIPKGNGKMRLIEPPCDELKAVQTRILKLLNKCNLPGHLHGFVRGRSAYKGLRGMVDRVGEEGDLDAVFSTDITDFFPSVKEDQVRETVFRYLVRILNKWEKGPKLPTEMIERLTDIITQLCCLHGRLPQGAPTSPALANMVGTAFDHQIIKVLPQGQVYGRYADDIVIMGLERLEPKLQTLIKSIMASFGFQTSHKKTTDESKKDMYKVWGVEVLPKKTTKNKETIIFKLPAALEDGWKKEIFEYINSDGLPTTTTDLMTDKRYMSIMGKLSHAYTVAKFGDPSRVYKDFLLPPKLAFAWRHLCKKFEPIMPLSHVNAFVKNDLEYETTAEYLDVTPEIFAARIKTFIGKNNFDAQSFNDAVEVSKKKIIELAQEEDAEIDIAIASPHFENLVDGYDDLTDDEIADLSLSLYADLCAFAQLYLENKNNPNPDAAIRKIVKAVSDNTEASLLPGDLYELWEDFRKKLGAKAAGHKYLFWNKEKRIVHKLKDVQTVTSGMRKAFLRLPGFAAAK